MVDKEIVLEWLAKADEDYQFALRNLKDDSTSFYGLICFHFQQSAEKYLKAYIVANELEFVKTHDLISLASICEAHNPSFSVIKEQCKFLNVFYIEPRYPVPWSRDVTADIVERANQAASEIGKFVKNLLGIDTFNR